MDPPIYSPASNRINSLLRKSTPAWMDYVIRTPVKLVAELDQELLKGGKKPVPEVPV